MRTVLRVVALASFALTCLSITSSAKAEPADYVITPIVEQGEREVDVKAGTSNWRDGTRAGANSIGFGVGVNNWWFTEVYAKWYTETGQSYGFDAWEWENRVQLTETGQYPVDLGILLEIERPADRTEGYEYRWGPLLQADLTNSVQGNLNILIDKYVRCSVAAEARLGYQWQLKYRWKQALELGAQGLGDLGPWNDWEDASKQLHIAGPAVFGRIDAGNRQAVKYNAGLLWGLNRVSPHRTLRVQVEYEF